VERGPEGDRKLNVNGNETMVKKGLCRCEKLEEFKVCTYHNCLLNKMRCSFRQYILREIKNTSKTVYVPLWEELQE